MRAPSSYMYLLSICLVNDISALVYLKKFFREVL